VFLAKYSIEECQDWTEYSDAWNEMMKEFYWYKESPVFDWNRDEELDAIRSDIGKDGRLFIVAREKKTARIIGLLGATFNGVTSQLRRWEPATLSEVAGTQVAKDLVNGMMRRLKEKGVRVVRVLLKYPHGNPESTSFLRELFTTTGFRQVGQPGVDLVLKLHQTIRPVEPKVDYEVRTGESLTPEEMAEYVIAAYASTLEDRALFEPDSSVTEYDGALEFVSRVVRGDLGPAPSEFRRALFVDGEPAAHVGAFVNESAFKPLTGVLGPVGVLPQFRRKGIGRFLVEQVLEALRRFGCEYAAAGTGASNVRAIKFYERMGFRLACDLEWYERNL